MKIRYMLAITMLVGASVAHATLIDMIGSTATDGGGEFADYSGLTANQTYIADWGDSVVNDGTVSLTVGDETNSVARFNTQSYKGAGTEINFAAGATPSSSTNAISANTYISFVLDSTAYDSDQFTLDSISVALWRNGPGSAKNYQFAYDADGDGYDTGDLLGSAVEELNAGTANTFAVSSGSITTSSATQQDIRLYYWGGPNAMGNSHLYEVETVYTIPEPATLGLVAATGLGMLFVRRKFMM